MAYTQGSTILALDYNTLRDAVDAVYGVGTGDSGYNQTGVTLPTVTAAVDTIASAEWTDLRTAILACANHQNTPITLLPDATVLESGDLVVAHDGVTDPDDFPEMATLITTNRFSAPVLNMTETVNPGVSLPQTSTNVWNASGVVEVNFDFGTEDAARGFFNSGGEIRVSCSRAGGTASLQNTTWTNLCTAIGTTALGRTATTSGGTGTAIGYYDLTGAYQTIASDVVGVGAYSASTIVVSALATGIAGVNGGNGTTVRMRIQFLDSGGGTPDSIDGTLTVNMSHLRATTFLTIPSPVVTVVTPFSGVNPT